MRDESEQHETVEAGPGATLDRMIVTGRRPGLAPADEPGPETVTKEDVEAVEHASSEHSPWPVVVAVGMLLLGAGILIQPLLAVLGGIVLLLAAIGWLWEPWSS